MFHNLPQNAMWILVAAIIVIGTIALGASLLFDKDTPITYGPSCKGCAVATQGCEQDCLIEAAVRDIEYFDDEELDRYKGKASNTYTAEEVDLFRQVMETLSADALRAWNRSLILRGINMPDDIKDEYILLTST